VSSFSPATSASRAESGPCSVSRKSASALSLEAARASRLPRLLGRGRAFEILLGGDDFDGDLAERYGYVNCAIPDAAFEDFVDRFARRVSTFDRHALADIKHFVNKASLPADEEFPPQMVAFWEAAARPALQARASKAFEDGLQERSDVELRLGEYVGRFAEADLSLASTKS